MRAYRSPGKLFAFGVFGIILIVAAIDVLFGHWISTVPENTDGILTTRGQAQQRGDLVWGAAMVGVGSLLVGGAVIELVRRRPMAQVTSDGLVLPIGTHERDVEIPWGRIDSVSSDMILDPYDGSHREVLVVELVDVSGMPADPIGATWDQGRLLVDAHDWTRPVTEIALTAQGALGHHRRVEEIKQMGPPSMEWDVPADERGDGAVVAVATVTDEAVAPVDQGHEGIADQGGGDADPPPLASATSSDHEGTSAMDGDAGTDVSTDGLDDTLDVDDDEGGAGT